MALQLTPQPLPLTQKFRFSTVPVGSVAYGSMGTAVSAVNGTTYWGSVYITGTVTLTGIGVLNAGTVGTSLGLVGLYTAAGALVGSARPSPGEYSAPGKRRAAPGSSASISAVASRRVSS